MAKHCIIILGMHRSGTSALTRVLSLYGATLPKKILGPNKGNQKGHWEPERLIPINDMLLAELGSEWNDWRQFNINKLPQHRINHYKKEISRTIAQDYNNSNIIILKEPRISRIASIYQSVLEELNYELTFIHSTRNPKSVSASLLTRDNIPEKESELLWMRYIIDAELATRGKKRAFISYEKLIHNHANEINRISKILPFSTQQNLDTINQINDFLDPSLQHHINERSDNSNLTDNNNIIERTYHALLMLEKNALDCHALNSLDKISNEFNRSCSFIDDTVYQSIKNLKQDILNKENTISSLHALYSEKKHESEKLSKKVAELEHNLNQVDNSLKTARQKPLLLVRDKVVHTLCLSLATKKFHLSQKTIKKLTRSANKRDPNRDNLK